MDLFTAIKSRRSIRKFKDEPFPDAKVREALELALLAPNSSNMQTWNFYWIKNPELKKRISEYCMNQSAARTANHLIVCVADPKLWKRARPQILNYLEEIKAPSGVKVYYEKLVPFTYRWGFLNSFAPLKFVLSLAVGLFRPITRGPFTKAGLQEVASKSVALACENFMLAITALGGATCPMEGFDEWRVKRALKLPSSARVAMIISVGYEGERATWGPQFRIPSDEVIHII